MEGSSARASCCKSYVRPRAAARHRTVLEQQQIRASLKRRADGLLVQKGLAHRRSSCLKLVTLAKLTSWPRYYLSKCSNFKAMSSRYVKPPPNLFKPINVIQCTPPLPTHLSCVNWNDHEHKRAAHTGHDAVPVRSNALRTAKSATSVSVRPRNVEACMRTRIGLCEG